MFGLFKKKNKKTSRIRIGAQEAVLEISRRRGMKNMTLRIKPGSTISVSKPWLVSDDQVISFIKKNAVWIQETLSKQQEVVGDMHEQTELHYKKHKEAARSLVMQKLKQWNAHYNFDFNSVAIRRALTRWGSCSSKRNLNFNYKIVFLPKDLQDYLIVHELCHLKEMNHSSQFWDLVGITIPEYKKRRKELKAVLK